MNHETKSLVSVFSNLAFSIAIPIYILNSTTFFTPEIRLLIAIAFPLFYGAFEWWKTKKHNFVSLLGLVNVIITGGFGLLQLSGGWFSFKEASFPFLIGLFVLISGLRNNPFFGKMLMSPDVFNTDKLESRLKESNQTEAFHKLVLRSNHILALSFFISALLNFLIAEQTFTPISDSIAEVEKANLLNAQIALMHKRGFLGIAIPSMAMLLGLLIYYFKQVEKITGESIEAFLHQTTEAENKSAHSSETRN
ncbi:MAG: hypothetical protein RJB66_54 [Pseudomonadota bacterium]